MNKRILIQSDTLLKLSNTDENANIINMIENVSINVDCILSESAGYSISATEVSIIVSI